MARLQAAFRKFYGHYNDLIYPYNLSLGRMLSDMFYNNRYAILDTDLDYDSYRLPNLEKGLTVGVIEQQGMLTPPLHLITPMIYS
jgi:hypothetical protein